MAKSQATINIPGEGSEETTVPAVITSIQQGDVYAPFGMKGTDILIYSDEQTSEVWGTLQDFFEEWVAFKKTWNDFVTNAKFIQYEHTNIADADDINGTKVYAPDFGVKMLFEINDAVEMYTPTEVVDDGNNNGEDNGQSSGDTGE